MIPVKYEELEGHTWGGIGNDDCYKLAMDFYDLNFGIKLVDYARPADWSADDIDLIRELHEHNGFQMITDWKPSDLRPGDALALMVGEGNPNHIAIYLGDNEILHHLYNRYSRREPFMGFWRNHVAFVLRHPEVPDLRPPKITQDLSEFIRARNTLTTE